MQWVKNNVRIEGIPGWAVYHAHGENYHAILTNWGDTVVVELAVNGREVRKEVFSTVPIHYQTIISGGPKHELVYFAMNWAWKQVMK